MFPPLKGSLKKLRQIKNILIYYLKGLYKMVSLILGIKIIAPTYLSLKADSPI